jgi:hypothetical protein
MSHNIFSGGKVLKLTFLPKESPRGLELLQSAAVQMRKGPSMAINDNSKLVGIVRAPLLE